MVNSFKDKKVLVVGLGLHGGALAVIKWLVKHQAQVTVTDLKTAKELKSSLDKLAKLKIKYTLGQHRVEDFLNQDLIIKNPAVPYSSKYLQNLPVPIIDEAVMFFGLYPSQIIGVTGTRGKSTVSTLIHQILKTKLKTNVVTGNIATSPMLEVVDRLKKNSYPVVELSSWHLETLDKYHQSPQIAVVTNVLIDHLNRYHSFNDYQEAKWYITKHQTNKDYVVLNYDNKYTREFGQRTKAKVYYFSLKNQVKGTYLKKDTIYFNTEAVMKIDQVKLLGQHNLANILASITVAKLMKISNINIAKAVNSFKGIDYRLEYKGKIKGISIFNDSTATTPDATLAALSSFSEEVVLICGGEDKVLDYSELAKQIKKQVSWVILLPGTGSNKLRQELTGYTKLIKVNSLAQAWKVGLSKAKSVLLFSPAAASFNMFVNEFDRARQFDKLYEKEKK